MTTLNSKCHNQKCHSCLYNAERFFICRKCYITYVYMGSRDLPDMSAIALGCCVPSGSCIHIRQVTPAHVTYITYPVWKSLNAWDYKVDSSLSKNQALISYTTIIIYYLPL